MKKNYIKYTLFLLLLSSSCFAQENIREHVTLEIESIIKSQYGDDYSVGIEFADSLIGTYSKGGYYKFEDPNHLLQGCILFSAEDDSGSMGSIFGIYKNGNILWHTDPIIDGSWMDVLLIKDIINNDSKIDIITKWYIPDADFIWIFSWDGTTGNIINDYEKDSTSVFYGESRIVCNFNSFQIFDYANNGILEMRCGQGTTEVTFSWNGSLYGYWPSTPQVPSNYIFPANRLTVKCKAKVERNGYNFAYLYSWSNDSSSEQSVNSITLFNSSCDGEVESPWRWLGKSGGTVAPIIGWSAVTYYEQMILPSTVKDSFKVNCDKYPKIIDFYIQGNCLAPDFSTYEEVINDLIHNSFHGYTIGPGDQTENIIPFNFIDTLLQYSSRSSELGWMTNQTTANKYDSLFNLTKAQLQQNNNNTARATLQTVLQQVDIDSTNYLTSEAYALLRYNTEYLLENIPQSSPNLLVNLKNSQGVQIPASNVMYYDASWKDAVDNGDGTFTVVTSKPSVSVRVFYEGANQTVNNVPAQSNSYTFQTVNTAVQLKNSLGNLIDQGTVQYYAGAWRDVGTTSNGVAYKELLPVNYSFRMTYEYGSIDKQQDISVNPIVVFQTVNAAVQLKNSLGNLIDQGAVQYYTGAWRDFGTTSNGVAYKELLPKNYSFRMTYENVSNDKQQDLSVNPVVDFSTVLCSVKVSKTSNNQPVNNAAVKYYAGAWRELGTTDTNGIATKELLPKNISFRATYSNVSQDKQQDISVNNLVEILLNVP
jgi:hypothetical protein